MTLETGLTNLYHAIGSLPRPDDFREIENKVAMLPTRERHMLRNLLVQERDEKFTGEKQPYAGDNRYRHFESCMTCEERLTAGYVTIVNPNLGEQLEIPYAALHFMETHDTTDYNGSMSRGTVDVESLKRVLGMTDSDSN